MKFYFTLHILLLSTLFSANASDSTKIKKTDYKLSKSEFIAEYGHINGAEPLIKLYFKKRKNAMLSPVLLSAIGLFTTAALAERYGVDNHGTDYIPIYTIVTGSIILVPVAIFSAIRAPIVLIKYSRKKLYIQLQHMKLHPSTPLP